MRLRFETVEGWTFIRKHVYDTILVFANGHYVLVPESQSVFEDGCGGIFV